MFFCDFIEKISLKISVNTISNHLHSEICSIGFLDGRETFFADTTLYFGYHEQIKTGQYPPQCILAAKDCSAYEDLPLSVSEQNEQNIAFISSDDLFFVVNEAHRSISIPGNEGIYRTLLSIGMRNYDSMEYGTNTAASFVGNPLFLFGNDMNLISHSTIFPITDPFWQSVLSNGYLAYGYYATFFDTQKHSLLPGEPPFVLSLPESSERLLVQYVFLNKDCLGMVVMPEQNESISSLHMEYLPVIAQAAAEILYHYTPYLISGRNIYQRTLYDMLAGAPREQLALRMKGMYFPKYMYCVCIPREQPDTSISRKFLYKHIAAAFAKKYPEMQIVFYKGGITGIMQHENPSVSEIALCDYFGSFAEEYRLHIGFSDVFTDPLDFPLYYQQAYYAVANTGSSHLPSENDSCELRIHAYRSYALSYLAGLAEDADARKMFCHPALSILQHYDCQNSTSLYQTLKVWLNCGCSIKEASALLYIHRNTMNYRLSCIREMTGICFDDPLEISRLILSFIIDENKL